MTDIRIKNDYQIQGATAKRDHHADSTLTSVRRRDEECKRRHREQDTIELSTEADPENPEHPPPEDDHQPKDSSTPDQDSADDEPGSHLDVQA